MSQDNKFKQASELLALGTTSQQGLDAAIKAYRAVAEDQGKTSLSLIVALVYAAAVMLVLMYLAARGLFWTESVTEPMLEFFKIAVIPVVTLVLGYVFGTSKRA